MCQADCTDNGTLKGAGEWNSKGKAREETGQLLYL